MVKKNIKLCASVVSLILIFALMAFAVSAVINHSVSVNTSVSFKATGVSGTITGTLTGTDSKTYYYNSTSAVDGTAHTFSVNGEALPDWTLGSETPLNIDSTDGEASNLVYTFTITNSSTTNAIAVTISDLTVGTNLKVASVMQDTASITGTAGDYTFTNIASSASTTIVITIDVDSDVTSITNQNISFSVDLSNGTA